ncbi:11344_t:CDS:1, partial [Gigaspora rosea]
NELGREKIKLHFLPQPPFPPLLAKALAKSIAISKTKKLRFIIGETWYNANILRKKVAEINKN